MKTFKPQETTMNSFQRTEVDLFERFRAFGYDESVAKAIANTFTHYMLGYVTLEGAAQTIVAAGADESTARALVETFRVVRDDPDAAARRFAN